MADSALDQAGAIDFVSYLPERIWYLTATGTDMWCRRPYTFFFTSPEAAQTFVEQLGSSFALTAIGVLAREVVSEEGIAALRQMQVTRIFLDPRHDPTTGDVFGPILRLDPVQ